MPKHFSCTQIRIRWRGAARARVHARLSHWHHTKDLRGGHGPGRETLSGAAAVHTQQEFGKQKQKKINRNINNKQFNRAKELKAASQQFLCFCYLKRLLTWLKVESERDH